MTAPPGRQHRFQLAWGLRSRCLAGSSSRRQRITATKVTSYTMDIFRAGANPSTALPTRSQKLGKPAVINGDITVDIAALVQALPTGSYFATVTAIGAGGSSPQVPVTHFCAVTREPIDPVGISLSAMRRSRDTAAVASASVLTNWGPRRDFSCGGGLPPYPVVSVRSPRLLVQRIR